MKPWLPVSVGLLAAACVTTNVDRLDQTVRPARAPSEVAVLLEKPIAPYTVVAVVEANAKSVFDTFEDLRRALVAEAARLGGEAVILGEGSTDAEFILTGTAMIKSDTKRLTGEVIVFDHGR